MNASIEAAHLLLQVAGLGDAEAGTTVTPTLLSAGTTTNTVPAEAGFSVDVRVRTLVEQDRVDAAMRALAPTLAGARIVVEGGPNRPPLEHRSSAGLFALAARVAADAGLPPLEGIAVGGASDGNFTAGLGVPTLDGLGAVGGGAHAEDEHVIAVRIPERTDLLEGILRALLSGSASDPVEATAATASGGGER